MFVECKADNERFTKPELAFIWGANEVGIPLACFAAVRVGIDFPTRQEPKGIGR